MNSHYLTHAEPDGRIIKYGRIRDHHKINTLVKYVFCLVGFNRWPKTLGPVYI